MRWHGTITDTGPLTRKRMETIDEEVTTKALDFMERAAKAKKPFFLWWNSTRMHVFTHLAPEAAGKTGLASFAACVERFVDANALHGICGVAGLGNTPYRDGSVAYYLSERIVDNDPKGVGALFMALAEALRAPHLS